MSDPLTLIETAGAACPAATLAFSGITDDAFDALDALVSAYTDGYKVTAV